MATAANTVMVNSFDGHLQHQVGFMRQGLVSAKALLYAVLTGDFLRWITMFAFFKCTDFCYIYILFLAF